MGLIACAYIMLQQAAQIASIDAGFLEFVSRKMRDSRR